MLVILQENIKKLGVKGSVVKVKAGYGRNYLLPQKKVLAATKANLAVLEKNKAILKKQNIEELEKAKKVAESLKNLSLSISHKANLSTGKLFGSIMPRDIVEEIEKSKIKISTKEISLPQIKQIGDYIVEIALHPQVILKLPLSVKAIKDDTSV